MHTMRMESNCGKLHRHFPVITGKMTLFQPFLLQILITMVGQKYMWGAKYMMRLLVSFCARQWAIKDLQVEHGILRQIHTKLLRLIYMVTIHWKWPSVMLFMLLIFRAVSMLRLIR